MSCTQLSYTQLSYIELYTQIQLNMPRAAEEGKSPSLSHCGIPTSSKDPLYVVCDMRLGMYQLHKGRESADTSPL